MAKIDSKFEEALISYLGTKRVDSKTSKRYIEAYHKFINIYPELNQKNVDCFLTNDMNSPSRSMIKNLLKAIIRWDFPQEIKQECMLIDIPKITGKKEDYVPRFIKKSDIDRLMIGIRELDDYLTERIKLMISVQFYAGLRINELIGLTYNSLNKEKGYDNNKDALFQSINISSTSAKFGKERMAYVPTDIYKRLLFWIKMDIEKHKERIFNPDDSIWGIKESRYRYLLDKWTMAILGEKYNSHSLRHGRGTDLIIEQHKNIEFVKKYLGHSDIKSTQVYVHINDKDVKNELEKESNS